MRTRKVVLKVEEGLLRSLLIGAFVMAAVLAFGWATTIGASAAPVGNPGAATGTATTSFTIQGMTCGSCVARVSNALAKLNGILDKQVAVGSAVVKYDTSKVSAEQIAAAISKIGYTVTGSQPVETVAAEAPPAAPSGCGCGGCGSGGCGGATTDSTGCTGDHENCPYAQNKTAKPAGGCGCGG